MLDSSSVSQGAAVTMRPVREEDLCNAGYGVMHQLCEETYGAFRQYEKEASAPRLLAVSPSRQLLTRWLRLCCAPLCGLRLV